MALINRGVPESVRDARQAADAEQMRAVLASHGFHVGAPIRGARVAVNTILKQFPPADFPFPKATSSLTASRLADTIALIAR